MRSCFVCFLLGTIPSDQLCLTLAVYWDHLGSFHSPGAQACPTGMLIYLVRGVAWIVGFLRAPGDLQPG